MYIHFHCFVKIRELTFRFSQSIFQLRFIIETYIFDTRLGISLRIFLRKRWWRSVHSRKTEGIYLNGVKCFYLCKSFSNNACFILKEIRQLFDMFTTPPPFTKWINIIVHPKKLHNTCTYKKKLIKKEIIVFVSLKH